MYQRYINESLSVLCLKIRKLACANAFRICEKSIKAGDTKVNQNRRRSAGTWRGLQIRQPAEDKISHDLENPRNPVAARAKRDLLPLHEEVYKNSSQSWHSRCLI